MEVSGQLLDSIVDVALVVVDPVIFLFAVLAFTVCAKEYGIPPVTIPSILKDKVRSRIGNSTAIIIPKDSGKFLLCE